MRICYNVNGACVTLLTSGIYKHMKRAATICLRDKATIALFFSTLSNFYFDLRPPRQTHGTDPRARQRSENPTPGATRMCKSPGVARGGWSGLELADTLFWA